MDKDRMDTKTEQELLRIENHLTSTFSKLITDGFKEIKESITELFNKDIEYMKETQKRFSNHHEEHFINDKARANEIMKVKETINDKIHLVVDDKLQLLETQISNIKENQIKCQARSRTTDQIEEKTDRKKNTSYAFWGVVIAALAFAAGTFL